jgi:hypothetical protein
VTTPVCLRLAALLGSNPIRAPPRSRGAGRGSCTLLAGLGFRLLKERGGGSCPIRYQCAGCGFYRPDPSYLPALEQHIASLRADLETARAMGAAEYVLASLTSEIRAFTTVADKMRNSLSRLDPAQRAEVEEASKLLRRARAARTLPLTDITARAAETA